MLRIYLVRHGVTVWNSEGRLQGHTDVPLSAEGMEQARKLAHRLCGEVIDAVWSSDLARARMTAQEVARPHRAEVVTTPRLRETMMGDWEGLTEAEVTARGEADHWRAWRHAPTVHRPPGSEPQEEVWERLLSVRDDILRTHPHGTVVVVGHGGSLRVLLCDAVAAPLSSLNRFSLENTSLSLIEYTEHRVRIRFVNDTSHLKD